MQLAGLKESSHHFAKADQISNVVNKHVASMLADLDIDKEDRKIVFDDIFHTIKRYLTSVMSEAKKHSSEVVDADDISNADDYAPFQVTSSDMLSEPDTYALRIDSAGFEDDDLTIRNVGKDSDLSFGSDPEYDKDDLGTHYSDTEGFGEWERDMKKYGMHTFKSDRPGKKS